MIFDYNFFELDIELPIRDYRNWLIVDVKHEPPNLSDYTLKGNKIYVCVAIDELPLDGKEIQVYRCKFDLKTNIFVDPDGMSLELVTDPRTAKQVQLRMRDGHYLIDGDSSYDNLLRQAYHGFELTDDLYYVFSNDKVFKITWR